MQEVIDIFDQKVRKVPASHAINWITDAWALFIKAPWLLVAMWMLLTFIFSITAAIPFLPLFLTPPLVGGYMIAVGKLDRGEPIRFDDFFAAFKSHGSPLFVMGAFLVGMLLVLVIVVLIGIAVILSAMHGGANPIWVIASIIMVAVFGLTFLALVMSAWYAPCLVIFQQQEAADAFKNTLRAFTINWFAGLVYGVILLILHMIALIPMGLGIFIMGPIGLISAYCGYKEMFTEQQ